ncbi:hypothetical protein [Roseimaritima sediminicola]|nr:hypothetical protein [Roseimaritima sediminicola]
MSPFAPPKVVSCKCRRPYDRYLRFIFLFPAAETAASTPLAGAA